ncbi:hypothetical protein [Mycoplasmopsis alligatoris]|uniref:Lipoprotein n=1 Tax=Mycoplasmopsis alligatoris A21JP2 TaxID=747682 RepID=D4XV07_9BACT|nr:hypothetical protein [Mycoplasmopsis alligatoris]EFF41801.1 hypothetical protein MALL_0165 [Mycoplasmopsis alligatoris A21JP2]
MKTKLKTIFLSTILLSTIGVVSVVSSCQMDTNKKVSPKKPAPVDPGEKDPVAPVIPVKTDDVAPDFLPKDGQAPKNETEFRAVFDKLSKEEGKWKSQEGQTEFKWDEIKKLPRHKFIEVELKKEGEAYKFEYKEKPLTTKLTLSTQTLFSFSNKEMSATAFFDGSNLSIFGKETKESTEYLVWKGTTKLSATDLATYALEDFKNYTFNLENLQDANKNNTLIYLVEVKRLWTEVMNHAGGKLYITNKENKGRNEFIQRSPKNRVSDKDYDSIREDAFIVVEGKKIMLKNYFKAFNNATILKPEDRLLPYSESLIPFIKPKSLEALSPEAKSDQVYFEFAIYKQTGDEQPVKEYKVLTSDYTVELEEPKL